MEHKCDTCNKIFSSKSNLYTHQKSAKYCLKLRNNESEEITVCEYCDLDFNRNSSLKRHILICPKKIKQEYLIQIDQNKQEYLIQIEQNKQEYERKIQELKQSHKLEIQELKQSYKSEIKQLKCNHEQEIKNIKEIDGLKVELSHEKGINEGMIKAKPISITNNTNNTCKVSNKIKNIPINNIQPFTEKLLQDNLHLYLYKNFLEGRIGYVKFIENLVILKLDGITERNYVCSDSSRNTYFRLIDSKEWQKDDGKSIINISLDIFKKIMCNYHSQLGKEISKDGKSELEEYYDDATKLYRGSANYLKEEREELVNYIHEKLKPKILI